MKKGSQTLKYFVVLNVAILFAVPEIQAAEKLVVRVDGLSCAFCAYTLEENLKDLEGVKEVEINLKEGTASLRLVEGKNLTDEVINRAVEDSGFTPRSILRMVE